MMRKEDVDTFAVARPLQPFEIQLVDGQRFRLTNIEQFIIGRNGMSVLTPKGLIVYVSLGLISTIRPLPVAKSRRPRKRA